MENKTLRSKIMRAIKSIDTSPEVCLRKRLWHCGLRYRKNYKLLPGTPDIVVTKYKIVVFVDGDFWHAKWHLNSPGEQVGTNKEFWRAKLTANVARDKEVNDALSELGWLVLRFWESDIKKRRRLVR